jgi:hypothetical protein
VMLGERECDKERGVEWREIEKISSVYSRLV